MAISRYDLLKAFATSNERGTAVGIRLKGRSNLLITTITDISGSDADNTVITVNQESIYGEEIVCKNITMSDIDHVLNLRIQFNDPFYTYLRSLRTNIRLIRQEVGFDQVA